MDPALKFETMVNGLAIKSRKANRFEPGVMVRDTPWRMMVKFALPHRRRGGGV